MFKKIYFLTMIIIFQQLMSSNNNPLETIEPLQEPWPLIWNQQGISRAMHEMLISNRRASPKNRRDSSKNRRKFSFGILPGSLGDADVREALGFSCEPLILKDNDNNSSAKASLLPVDISQMDKIIDQVIKLFYGQENFFKQKDKVIKNLVSEKVVNQMGSVPLKDLRMRVSFAIGQWRNFYKHNAIRRNIEDSKCPICRLSIIDLLQQREFLQDSEVYVCDHCNHMMYHNLEEFIESIQNVSSQNPFLCPLCRQKLKVLRFKIMANSLVIDFYGNAQYFCPNGLGLR